MTPYSPVLKFNVSEERTASIFRVEDKPKSNLISYLFALRFDPEDGSSTFL
jgi:hypothetical protein